MNSSKWPRFMIGGTLSFLFGAIFLHPLSMLFQGMTHPEFKINFSVFKNAFSSHHLPMALFFGALGSLMGCVIILLTDALSREKGRVKMLEGLLPICSYCKK